MQPRRVLTSLKTSKLDKIRGSSKGTTKTRRIHRDYVQYKAENLCKSRSPRGQPEGNLLLSIKGLIQGARNVPPGGPGNRVDDPSRWRGQSLESGRKPDDG